MPCWLKTSKNVSRLWGIEKVQLGRGKSIQDRSKKSQGEKRESFATVEFRITNVELYSTKGIGIVRNLG